LSSNYKFRLQKLLDIRINKEEECKLEFKKAVKEKNETEGKLRILEENYHKYNRFESEESIIERKIKLNYLNALNISINDTVSELEVKNEVLEEKRGQLMHKQIERKTVEILKEKGERAFIKEQHQIEQNNNDEFALYSFIRRNMKGGEISE
jgi:flagellar FliJ protein